MIWFQCESGEDSAIPLYTSPRFVKQAVGRLPRYANKRAWKAYAYKVAPWIAETIPDLGLALVSTDEDVEIGSLGSHNWFDLPEAINHQDLEEAWRKQRRKTVDVDTLQSAVGILERATIFLRRNDPFSQVLLVNETGHWSALATWADSNVGGELTRLGTSVWSVVSQQQGEILPRLTYKREEAIVSGEDAQTVVDWSMVVKFLEGGTADLEFRPNKTDETPLIPVPYGEMARSFFTEAEQIARNFDDSMETLPTNGLVKAVKRRCRQIIL